MTSLAMVFGYGREMPPVLILGGCSENAIDLGHEQLVPEILQTTIRGNVMHGFRYCDGSCGGTGGGIGPAITLHGGTVNGVLIEGNEIYDSASGIMVNASNVQIVNNVIHDLATDESTWLNAGLYTHHSENVALCNNTFDDLPETLFFIGTHTNNMIIKNNLAHRTGRVHMSDGATYTYAYNGWFAADQCSEGLHDVIGNDPKFVSPGDYHLQDTSPAIDAGDNESAPTHDFDGNPRPYGAVVDLGAFEGQRPPPVTNLWVSKAVTTTNSVTVTLIWTAPGQVGQPSAVDHYELRYDDQAITQGSWDQATVVDASIAAGQPGEAQSITVNLPWSGSGYLYFALRVFDVDSQGSAVSNPAFWPFASTFIPLVRATVDS
jgi:hypothetical protein